MGISTKKINAAQEEWYKNGELSLINTYIRLYSQIIEEMRTKAKITILDIGGGAGYFSRELLRQITAENSKVREVNIHLIDTHRYDTWTDDRYIHFVEGDALNIDSIYRGGQSLTIYFAICFFTICSERVLSRVQCSEKCV